MLVLSRKERQTILIGDSIEITICRVAGRRVSIGLRAPSELTIRRGELPRKLEPSARAPEESRRAPGLEGRIKVRRRCDVATHSVEVVAAQ
jgi:carbon storage regulator